jgi:hypothetical protein
MDVGLQCRKGGLSGVIFTIAENAGPGETNLGAGTIPISYGASVEESPGQFGPLPESGWGSQLELRSLVPWK